MDSEPEEPVATPLEGPLLEPDGSLGFRLQIGERVVRAWILPHRATAAPDDIPLPYASAALCFAQDFARKNALLVHQLLKRARAAATVPIEAIDASITEEPRLTESGALFLSGQLEGNAVSLYIEPNLGPFHVRLASGAQLSEQQFFGVYDAALDYLLANVDRVAALGFDVTALRAPRPPT